MCSIFDPVQCAADAAGAITDNAVTQFAEQAEAEFWSGFMNWVIVPWTKIDSPELMSSGAMWWLRQYMMWIAFFVMTISILISAGRMIWQQDGTPFKELVRSIVMTIFVATAGVALMDILLKAGDEFSQGILDKALETGFGERVADMSAAGGMPAGFAILIAAVIGLFLAMVQVVLMMMRSGLIVFMAALLPIAAASSAGPWGQQWFSKMIGWTFAAVIYKPLASILYAGAILMIGTGGGMTVLTGVAMMAVAVIVLPMLLTILVPQMAAVTSSGGGGAGMAVGMMGASAARGMVAGGPKGAAVGAGAAAASSTTRAVTGAR